MSWIALIVLNAFVVLYKELPVTLKPWVSSVLWEDLIGFSGANIELCRYWVVITATIDHATFHHLVNNMAMLCLGGYELGEIIGSLVLIGSFFITGAIGWLTTLVVTRYRYQGEMWEYAAKFQVSVGSSPATYGLATILATVSPDSCACMALNLSPWVWLSILFFCPPLVSEKYNVQIWKASGSKQDKEKEKNKSFLNKYLNLKRFIVYIAVVSLVSYVIVRPLFSTTSSSCAITTSGVLFIYSLYTVALKVSNSLIFGQSLLLRGSDHAAHLGGAVAGTLIGCGVTTSLKPPFSVVIWLFWLLLRLVTDI